MKYSSKFSVFLKIRRWNHDFNWIFHDFYHENQICACFYYNNRNHRIEIRSFKEIGGLDFSEVHPLLVLVGLVINLFYTFFSTLPIINKM